MLLPSHIALHVLNLLLLQHTWKCTTTGCATSPKAAQIEAGRGSQDPAMPRTKGSYSGSFQQRLVKWLVVVIAPMANESNSSEEHSTGCNQAQRGL